MSETGQNNLTEAMLRLMEISSRAREATEFLDREVKNEKSLGYLFEMHQILHQVAKLEGIATVLWRRIDGLDQIRKKEETEP